MNDDKLKTIIQSDKIISKRPSDEWSQINSKLEGNSPFNTKSISLAFTLCLLLITFVYNSNINEISEEDQLVEFLFEGDIYENNSIYAWVD